MKEYTSFVYAISNGTHIKIGVTNDIFNRIKKLQTGNHQRLKLLKLVPGDKELESELHRRFDHSIINGEWFEPHKDILDWIDDIGINDDEEIYCNVTSDGEGEFDLEFTSNFFALDIVDKLDCIADINAAISEMADMAQDELKEWAEKTRKG